MGVGARSIITQERSVRSSGLYSDQVTNVNTQLVAEGQQNLQGDLNVLRTLLRQVTGRTRFYQTPAASLRDLADNGTGTFDPATMNNASLFNLAAGAGDVQGAMQSWDAGSSEWESTGATLRYLSGAITVGNGVDETETVYRVDTGSPTSEQPLLRYDPNYQGYALHMFRDPRDGVSTGLAVESKNAAAGVQAFVTGPDAWDHESSLSLLADNGVSPGTSMADVRGWEITREGVSHDLAIERWDGSTYTTALSFDFTTLGAEFIGGVRVGDSTATEDGYFRYNSTTQDFEGRKNGVWTSFTGDKSMQADSIVLNATDITNKFVTTSQDLTDASAVALMVKGAGGQFIGDDFSVDAGLNRVSWNGLGLDGDLAVGDSITILYK